MKPSPHLPRRGREMTRLETFTDAAFAFAVTLLAISIDEIPKDYDSLILALKGTPAFIASFALLLLYWRAHQNWSRRYGLEDLPSVLLTFGLVLVVMVYVYPLKIMFSAAFSFMSNGWLPASFELASLHQFRVFVTIFGVGMFALSGLISALYAYAWSKREELNMHVAERFDTAAESFVWLFIGGFGLLSVALAWLLPDRLLHLSTWVYWLLLVLGPILDKVQDRLVGRRLPAD